jgi:hypothetical protein
MSEQRVPVWTANQFKQMADEDVCIFYHNLPPFLTKRMSCLGHPVLRQRQAMPLPAVSPLPPLTPITLRSPLSPLDDDDELMNPDDFE